MPEFLSIPDIAESLTGERPSPPTCWRWVHRGCQGIRLKAVFIHGAWRTTRDDFVRFLEERSAAKLGNVVNSPAADDAALAAAGLI